LLTALLGDSAASQPLKPFILAKTAGNPFFMEELVQTLLDQGVLRHNPAGGMQLAAPVTSRALAQQLAHPLSLALALYWAAVLHHLRRELSLTQVRAEAAMTLATDYEFLRQFAQATPLRGWALAASGHGEEGITQIRLAVYRATRRIRQARDRASYLALLAEACAQAGQSTEGLEAVGQALATVDKSAVRWWETERGLMAAAGSATPSRRLQTRPAWSGSACSGRVRDRKSPQCVGRCRHCPH
jgi:hypothetical protein